jgi:putative transcriptional regulator
VADQVETSDGAAAQREVWTGAQLQWLLTQKVGLELSSASVSALFTKQPSQLKLSTLIALCTALDCTPNDLFDIDTTECGCFTQ